MDIHSTTGIDTQVSNEEQRNWSDSLWQKKLADGTTTYDRTRSHLNFEITKGGVIQPIDSSKTIMQKFRENIAARGIRDPNNRPNPKRLNRTMAQIIFMGSHERMLEIAFGNQEVKPRGEDNSGLTRQKDIEDWARDVYDFAARKFGEENIVSFYVHLDERTPHIHCTVIPVNDQNRISWKSVFGDSKSDGEKILTRLHDELEEDVNRKWGLERGDSTAETKAKHRSTEEYKRDLISQVHNLENKREYLLKVIQKEERKLKSLTTMIANSQERKEKIQEEIDLIALQFGQEGVDNAELAAKMKALRKELQGIDAKIERRQSLIEEANETLAKARAELERLNTAKSQVRSTLGDDIDKKAAEVEKNIMATYNKMVASSVEPLLPTLTPQQEDTLDRNGYYDLTENAQDVINCALLLAIRYVDGATTYAHSCGGGGSNLSGWGRDKDDDDECWWMRCISKSAEMVRPAGRKASRRR